MRGGHAFELLEAAIEVGNVVEPRLEAHIGDGLVAIGQSGGLELHPWGCKPGDPETPEQVTFDLDPDEGLDFDDVIAAAKTVRKELESLGLNAFVGKHLKSFLGGVC